MLRKSAPALVILFFFLQHSVAFSQCTELGQNPSTAFPVCGTAVFHQSTVPLCQGPDINVPGCVDGANYSNLNPFWYKFTCFASGTLNFIITPIGAQEDYDWQLFDVTGHAPNDVYTDPTLFVAANWAGTYGPTGASPTGSASVQCSSDPVSNHPTFELSPQLIVGHDYLLLISHFTPNQSGYDLSFAGGTAVITDPLDPHLLSASAGCDGKTITVKLNKKMKCGTLSADGSEFSLVPAATTVVSAVSADCTAGFDFTEITITLQNALPNGNFQLIINPGADGNTLLDNCGRAIPNNEPVSFHYAIPQPIFADSLGTIGCAPDEIKVYFPKKIDCTTIAADGTDFSVTGPTAVTVASAAGLNCQNGKSDILVVKLSSPIYTKGNYLLTLKAGTDGNIAIDECGIALPVHSLPFTTVDTVSADFAFTMDFGCRNNTLHFTHDGAHDVTNWNWLFNHTVAVTSPSYTIVLPASSTNTVELTVTNGVCTSTVSKNIVLDNEVKANFFIPDIICPEDLLVPRNASKGLIDIWKWTFGTISSSGLQEPTPVQFPMTNIETSYIIKLVVRNTALGCSDSLQRKLLVLNNCYIAVPTAFTPNGDGLNDYLYPNNAIKAENLQFKVFNRWGQLVFSTRNWQEKWNGKIGDMPQASGVYVWFLEYTRSDTKQKVFQKGTTTLIR